MEDHDVTELAVEEEAFQAGMPSITSPSINLRRGRGEFDLGLISDRKDDRGQDNNDTLKRVKSNDQGSKFIKATFPLMDPLGIKKSDTDAVKGVATQDTIQKPSSGQKKFYLSQTVEPPGKSPKPTEKRR